MRKSFNGLENIAREILNQDPLSGHLFVFINKSRNRLKSLWWDGDGLCIIYKRLEKGTFLDSLSGITQDTLIAPHIFYMLFNGIDIHQIKKRKRFSLTPE
jgi:transposase